MKQKITVFFKECLAHVCLNDLWLIHQMVKPLIDNNLLFSLHIAVSHRVSPLYLCFYTILKIKIYFLYNQNVSKEITVVHTKNSVNALLMKLPKSAEVTGIDYPGLGTI